MVTLVQVIVMGFLVEALWENLKMVMSNGKISFDRVGSLVVGILIAFTMRVDVFALLGFSSFIPFVGVFATGVLISRGGNYIHDLFKILENTAYEDYNDFLN